MSKLTIESKNPIIGSSSCVKALFTVATVYIDAAIAATSF